MDMTVLTYLVYLAITIPLTIWVGQALRRNGELLLLDVFDGDATLANAVNQLLTIGFYLLNFGYVSYFMATSEQVEDLREVMEVVSTKVGVVAVVIGILHFTNIWILSALRRRAFLNRSANPPVPPNRYTAVDDDPIDPTPGWAALG